AEDEEREPRVPRARAAARGDRDDVDQEAQVRGLHERERARVAAPEVRREELQDDQRREHREEPDLEEERLPRGAEDGPEHGEERDEDERDDAAELGRLLPLGAPLRFVRGRARVVGLPGHGWVRPPCKAGTGAATPRIEGDARRTCATPAPAARVWHPADATAPARRRAHPVYRGSASVTRPSARSSSPTRMRPRKRTAPAKWRTISTSIRSASPARASPCTWKSSTAAR